LVFTFRRRAPVQHARQLWEAAPKQMCDAILLVAWRAWYARNEATHSKPLPSIESSKRFLTGYMSILKNLKTSSTGDMIKGKQPVLTLVQFQTRLVLYQKSHLTNIGNSLL
jgi:hypothetical protein